MYGKKINSPRPLLDMATHDTTPHVTTLFHCVLFSNICPSRRRLQRPMLNANATEVLVDYSVFPFLWRVVYKLSNEVRCGEVTNPK